MNVLIFIKIEIKQLNCEIQSFKIENSLIRIGLSTKTMNKILRNSLSNK